MFYKNNLVKIVVKIYYIYTIKERCKLCGYVLYIQLRKGVSCVDMFYIYN